MTLNELIDKRLKEYVGHSLDATILEQYSWLILMIANDWADIVAFDKTDNSYKDIASKPDPRWHHIACSHCGRWYLQGDSDANIKQAFCCQACEDGY